MLRVIADKCTELLIKYGTIQTERRAIYMYGFELFWSTTFCVASVLIWGTIFGYLGLVFIFLLFFMPIRTVAGGYHAKSYGSCFILTNGIALFCVLGSRQLWLWKTEGMELLLWGMLAISFIYIWRNSPVISKKHPQGTARIIKNRRYAHVLLGVETVVLLVFNIWFNSGIVYTAILTSCIVAIMIAWAKKGGQ